jgi:transcriptional regulator with XRE-family HTH domain
MSMDPGLLLRESRASAGLTQAEVARRVGTTQAAVARVERGRVSPTVRTLQRLLAATGYELALAAAPAGAEVDETLIARQLRLPPAERLKSFEAGYGDVRRLAGAARRARGRVA